ncbi:response regulator transcription factor [Christiangramia salexigens]|uniref:HTH luxR-type domain-containing protein n=1 Tax=Christiangramia salexigens TaxID=1913577 RepID=A0A1L3J7D0_9FLAO|nr:helix-turn-helix transcriptional regulator [Christiangramia salexigens]APG61029.1 hypothetical protein LPB144_11705 [Christiangramia salexigens]
MQDQINRISDFWRKEYSAQIDEYDAFEVSEQFKQIASFFTPGLSYYYILNLHNLEIDFISEDYRNLLDVPREEVTMEKLLTTVVKEDLGNVENKEKVMQDFFSRYLTKEEKLKYKALYSYQLRDPKKRKHRMLIQATPLSLSQNGSIKHMLCIHSDISHYNINVSPYISFIDLKGEKSFINVDSSDGVFDPSLSNPEVENKFLNLTDREREIIKLLSKGKSTSGIADTLNISVHTVKTHRKNILQKSGCANTAELIAEFIIGGILNH